MASTLNGLCHATLILQRSTRDATRQNFTLLIEELLEEIKKYPSEEVYCIGGDSVYKQLLPYCDTAHVTKIDFGYEADSYFPNLDEMPEWKITAESDEQTYFDLEYSFVKYERVK